MNLTDMRAIVRRDLNDEDSANYRWTDDEINRHIAHAVKEFSEQLPDEQKATIATTAGSRELDTGTVTNRIMLEAVEYPIGQFPRRFQPFSLWGDAVMLLGEEVPDGSDACVYYGKLHVIDTNGSTVPARHEDIIAGGAGGFAAVEWAAYAINRVNVGGTKTPGDFLAWGNVKLRHFRQELQRLGRRNRVRTRLLYSPYLRQVSKTTDFGP